jgi:hypothetical protein
MAGRRARERWGDRAEAWIERTDEKQSDSKKATRSRTNGSKSCSGSLLSGAVWCWAGGGGSNWISWAWARRRLINASKVGVTVSWERRT